MNDLSDRFREAIPGWGKKERAEALIAIEDQIVNAHSSLLALEQHVVREPPSDRKFWEDVLSKRRRDVEELEGIKRQLIESIDT